MRDDCVCHDFDKIYCLVKWDTVQSKVKLLSILKMGQVLSCKILVNFFLTTWRGTPEYSIPYSR